MNCKNCNSPISPQARFCPVCGTPAEGNTGASEAVQATPIQPRPIEAEATLITPQQSMSPVIDPQSFPQQWQQIAQTPPLQSGDYIQPGRPDPYSHMPASQYPPQNQQSPFAQPAPLLQYDPNQIARGSQMSAAAMNSQQGTHAKRRSRGGCLLRLLAVLVLLLVILAGVWFLALRPYVHGIAENELNNAMTQAVNQVQPIPSQLPPNTTRPINEAFLENLIKLNLAPSSPVQQPVVHINQQGIRLEFQLYNFPCAISLLPALNNGNIVAHNVTVEGIVGLVMSSDEMSALLNQHLADAMHKLNHPIAGLQLKQGELDIALS
jgi:hypothetical protein